MSGDRLTEDEVANRAGATPDKIRQFARLGILEPKDGTYPRRDVLRARFVLGLEAIGIDADAVANALAAGDLTLGYVEFGGRRPPRSDRTFAEVSEEIDIPYQTLERIYVAFGLPRPTPEEYVREEDLRLLKFIPVLFGAGVREGEVLRLARVWGDNARRIAQFQSHYLHHSIEEPFRRRGLRDNEAFEAALREVGVRAGRVHAITQHLHDCATVLGGDVVDQLGELERHLRRHLVTGLLGQPCVTGKVCEHAGFDLPRFPPVYARVLESGFDMIEQVPGLEHLRMTPEEPAEEVFPGFHFTDPSDAVMASLEIVDRVYPEGLPPAHIGVNAGPMIYDEGDYFGRTVNIAARIASQAGSDQVFVGEDAFPHITPSGFRLVEVGAFELKCIAKPVMLYEASHAGDA